MNVQNQIHFLELYEPIHNQFCKFCRMVSGNPTDAEDLIQESILNILEKMDRIKDISLFKSYMFSVASNLNKMKLRRKKFDIDFNEAELDYIVDFG